MVAFFCTLIIPVFAVYFYNYIDSKEKKKEIYILEYLFFTFLINYIVLFAVSYLFNRSSEILTFETFTNSFTIKYSTLSIFLVVILPILIYYIKETVNIKFYITKEKKNVKKKKNNK